MKPIFLCCVVLAISLPTLAQEIKHAPALELCVADINLWISEISQWPKPQPEQLSKDLAALTFTDLRDRALFLDDCAHAYPELKASKSGELSAGIALISQYTGEIQHRMLMFLERHDLLQRFVNEDAAGKR